MFIEILHMSRCERCHQDSEAMSAAETVWAQDILSDNSFGRQVEPAENIVEKQSFLSRI
jgi:hypothetical protein